MVSQLEGGAIDLAVQPLIRDALRLAKDAKYQVVYNQNSGSVNVILTQTRDGAGPTTNKLFRQALNASMDRQTSSRVSTSSWSSMALILAASRRRPHGRDPS
jgi:ABC-type transport system substrate-binding protein